MCVVKQLDCDYDQREIPESKFKRQTRSSRKRGHKGSKLMEAVKREKPVFDPSVKSFHQYVDEYYGMEFEDVIGDMPCRFKYRKVLPNSYGLTVEEILAADDKELNQWCSMKKIDTIRPTNMEKFDLKIYSRKGKNLQLKKKVMPSLFQSESNENEMSDLSKQKNNVKTISLKGSDLKSTTNNHKRKYQPENVNNEISDERLKAYGINPKRYKNKLKYGNK